MYFVLLVGAMNYEAVLVMPDKSDTKPPLVVFPHGNIEVHILFIVFAFKTYFHIFLSVILTEFFSFFLQNDISPMKITCFDSMSKAN